MNLLWNMLGSSYLFSYLVSILLCLAFSTPPTVALPKLALPVNGTQHSIVDTVEHVVSEFSHSVLAAPVLIDDVDGDGHLDLYFATIDGRLYGVPAFLQCYIYSECETPRWSHSFRGERFISSAILIPVQGTGQNLLLFVSHRGAMFLFDHLGHLVAPGQIPSLLLPSSTTFDQRSFSDSAYLANALRWDLNVEPNKKNSEFYRLRPCVYTSPVVLTTATHRFSSVDASKAISIIVPVNFEAVDSGHLLAALVGFSQRSLLSTGLWGYTRPNHEFFPMLVPLQLGNVDHSPPYLLASPVIISNPQPSSSDPPRIWHPSFTLLVTVSSGYMFQISVPLDARTSRVHLLWYNPTEAKQYPHPCILVDHARASTFRLGCLLLDSSSHLQLIDVNSMEDDRRENSTNRLVWEYHPSVIALNPATPHAQQLAQVAVVPGDTCTDKGQCSMWAVYPAPDGRIHAVDIQSGQAVPNFPIPVDGVSSNSSTFTTGPGLLYTSADSTPWMLFSDTSGCFYHLRVKQPPVVLSANQTRCAFNEITHWLPPVPLLHHQLQPTLEKRSIGPELLNLVVASNDRIVILTTTTTTSTSNRNTAMRPKTFIPNLMFNYDVTGVGFTNRHGQPINVLHLHSDQEPIHYVIHDCPLQAEYLVQLLDFTGAPISEWSRPTSQTKVRSQSSNRTACLGSLSLSRFPEGPFRSRLYLQVVELGTGRLLSSVYSQTPRQEFAASILLEFHTFWPQLLVFWTYLLFTCFFIGIGFVNHSSSLIRSRKADTL